MSSTHRRAGHQDAPVCCVEHLRIYGGEERVQISTDEHLERSGCSEAPVEVLALLAAPRLVAEDEEQQFIHGGVLVAGKPTSDGDGDRSPRSLNISNTAKLADAIGRIKGVINGF